MKNLKATHFPTKDIFKEENLNRIALLGAFSMFLSTIEYLIPRPLPFMRLGLANLPLLLGLEALSGPSYIFLVIIKVLGQALVSGTLASYVFLFSLGGSVASAIIMVFCHRVLKKRISYIGISLMGALASNTVQIILSVNFIFGDAAWRILPAFLGIGLVSGFFMGLATQYFTSTSGWWQQFNHLEKTVIKQSESTKDPPVFFGKIPKKNKRKKKRKKRQDLLGRFLSPGFRFWTGIILIPAYLFIKPPAVKGLIVLMFILLALLSGKKIRLGYYIILIASITFFHLLTPYGRILGSIGPLKITTGALESGFCKGITLTGLILISLFSVSSNLRLPGRLGGLLARTFFFFEEILEGRGRIVPGRIMSSLDDLLTSMFPPDRIEKLIFNDTPAESTSGKTALSILFFLILNLILWGILIFFSC